jgi:hypothetical protein
MDWAKNGLKVLFFEICLFFELGPAIFLEMVFTGLPEVA